MGCAQLVAIAALVAPLSTLRPMFGGTTLPQHRRAPLVCMAKTKAKASRKAGQAKPRGFGKPPPKQGVLLEDPAYAELNEQLTSAGANLDRVAIADFDGLRGVMALVDLKKGDKIVSIPGPSAVNLGAQSVDPVLAAVSLLEAAERDAAAGRRQAYWRLLPPPDAADLCTPDFFSDEELAMLQWPPVAAEVRERAEAMRAALAATPAPSALAEASNADALRQLRWATFLVLSRVLTVQSPTGGAVKLLIPFLDMFNHRADCKHYLTGRTDGELRVVAGEAVEAGQQAHRTRAARTRHAHGTHAARTPHAHGTHADHAHAGAHRLRYGGDLQRRAPLPLRLHRPGRRRRRQAARCRAARGGGGPLGHQRGGGRGAARIDLELQLAARAAAARHPLPAGAQARARRVCALYENVVPSSRSTCDMVKHLRMRVFAY